MKKVLQRIALATLGMAFAVGICAQSTSSYQDNTGRLSPSLLRQYPDDIISRTNAMEKKLDKQSGKLLKRWQKLEERIKRKLSRTDSLKSASIFGKTEQQQKQLKQKLENTTGKYFIPSLDTLGTSLKFLYQNPQLLSINDKTREKLEDALESVNALENKFKNAEEIKNFLRERKKHLQEQLSQIGAKYIKQFKQFNKQVFYYGEQLNEYKTLLSDHKKAERKALELLSRAKPFKDFMRRNSQLASLFRLPADLDDPSAQASLAGLQTRAQVNNLIQQQLAIGGPDAQQKFRQNIEEAQNHLNQLKEKSLKNSSQGNSSDEEIEGFRPNNQKTKSFMQRLELGTNVQSQKPNGYFPVTSDIGLSLGYKLNNKSILGIGASYKIGWGQNIRNITITHQGVGLRGFVDWKLKGSFWMSGGYEMNYRNQFNRIDVLKELSAWQQSGLLGMSKIVSLKTKFFNKTKLQLLWDLLSYRQVPRTQHIIFRIGYSIK